MQGNCWPTEDRLLLLKAALLADERAVQAWETWLQRNEASFDIVDAPSYQLYPLVYRNLAKFNVTGAIFDKCKGLYRRYWTFNQLLWKKLDNGFVQLKENGIQKIVLLKGMAMIAEYYRDFGARIIGDVDALVSVDDIPLADRTLKQSGFTSEGMSLNMTNSYDLYIHHAIHYRIDKETCLDLHWAFLTESPLTGLDKEVLERAQLVAIQGKNFYIPDSTTLLLQTCVHGMKSTQVASLRWIADAVTILRQATIDWNQLIRMARCARITLPLLHALTYLHTQFEANIPANILNALAKNIPSRQERFEHWCNMRGYFFIVNWLQYCARREYHSWVMKLWCFPRFIQHRRHLPSLWHIFPDGVRWLKLRFA